MMHRCAVASQRFQSGDQDDPPPPETFATSWGEARRVSALRHASRTRSLHVRRLRGC